VRLLRKGTKNRFSMARLKSSRDYNISRSHPNISMEISSTSTKTDSDLTNSPFALSPLLEAHLATGHHHHHQRRAVSLERRHSGNSTGVVTDSFSSATASHSSSQDNSRATGNSFKDQIGRFSPSINSRSTSLSPSKCYPQQQQQRRSRSPGLLANHNQPAVISGEQQQRPPQRGPMRSRSSDRVVQSRHAAQDHPTAKESGQYRGKSAERAASSAAAPQANAPRHPHQSTAPTPPPAASQLREEDERKYDQIRARTLEYRRIRDSKVDFKKTPPIRPAPNHHHHQPVIVGRTPVTSVERAAATKQAANQQQQQFRRGSFGTGDAPRFHQHQHHLINNERFSSLSRITSRRTYQSPGTVSCQDFAPTPIPIQTKPYFTPDSQTLPYKDRGMQSNRRLNYESKNQPQHHLSTPFISRSKNI